MNLFHGVVFVDHYRAQVLQFGAEYPREHQLPDRLNLSRQHASGWHSQPEFFGLVCDALEGIAQVLVAGGHQALDDFRQFVGQHRPDNARRIVGYEVVGHPSENELVVIARNYFALCKQRDKNGVPGRPQSPTCPGENCDAYSLQ